MGLIPQYDSTIYKENEKINNILEYIEIYLSKYRKNMKKTWNIIHDLINGKKTIAPIPAEIVDDSSRAIQDHN